MKKILFIPFIAAPVIAALVIAALAVCTLSCQKLQELKQLADEFGDIEVTEIKVTEINVAETISKCLQTTFDLTADDEKFISAKFEELNEELATKGYKKISISYPSVDATGKEVRLSGAIYMPREPETFDEILLYCHQTATGNVDVPSSVGALCLEPIIVSKCPSCVCFASDYLGFNTSGSYNHPYMNNSLAARNELDMMKAGLVYLKQNGYKVKLAENGLKTYVIGYSQGGGVALATHKAIEQDENLCAKLNFCGTLCGDGPYNLKTTFQKFLDDGTLAMPFVLPYVLLGMYESYPESFGDIDIYEYLSPECKTAKAIEYLKSKPTLMEALLWFPENVGSDIEDLMSTEAQDLSSDIMTVLFGVLDKQNLLDGSWTPKKPLVLYHSENDNVVAFNNTKEALNLFPSDVCTRSSLDNGMYHIVEYVNFTANFIMDGMEGMMKE